MMQTNLDTLNDLAQRAHAVSTSLVALLRTATRIARLNGGALANADMVRLLEDAGEWAEGEERAIIWAAIRAFGAETHITSPVERST